MNAKQIIKLLEEISEVYDSPLVTYTTSHGTRIKKVHPIYVNPTKADYAEIYKENKHTEIKFIAIMETKKVYVWDAFYAIHETVAKHLGLGLSFIDDNGIFTGTGTIVGSKAVMGKTDRFDVIKDARQAASYGQSNWAADELATQLKMDWSWVNPYIDCSDYIKKAKARLSGVRSLLKKNS